MMSLPVWLTSPMYPGEGSLSRGSQSSVGGGGGHYYRLQRSWAKVMFLQAPVILSTAGGGSPAGITPPGRENPLPWQGDPPSRETPWAGRTPPPPQARRQPWQGGPPGWENAPGKETPLAGRTPLGKENPHWQGDPPAGRTPRQGDPPAGRTPP